MELFDLSGRVAVITGGNGGIGLGMGLGMAKAGATVVVAGREGRRVQGPVIAVIEQLERLSSMQKAA